MNIENNHQLTTNQLKVMLDSCACLSVKKAARTLTNLYDREFTRVGINSGQYAILLNIILLKSPTLNVLAEELNLKSSTMSRALSPLERDGLITMTAGLDKRTRCVRVTEKGGEIIKSCIPLWDKVQSRVRDDMGNDSFGVLLNNINNLSKIPSQI